MKTVYIAASSLINQSPHLQKMSLSNNKFKYKPLLTSAEMSRMTKLHKQPIKGNIVNTCSSYQSSVKNTQESERSSSLLKSHHKCNKNPICESQKLLGTNLHLSNGKNVKKIKQVSIDLQNKVLHTKIDMKKKNDSNPLIKSTELFTKKKIKNISTCSSNNKRSTSVCSNNTVNATETTGPSAIFSSISTFKTLFKISDKERNRISSKEQIKELEELNDKLLNIKNSNDEDKKINVLNANMLDEDQINITKKDKNIALSSNQRIQTYKLLLECINTKFKEIEQIVENDKENKLSVNGNNDCNKESELHSKIEFTQDQITTTDNNNNNILTTNPYDYQDEEMEEKSKLIVPEGKIDQSITSNMIKNKGEFDEKNLLSFLSNEMCSFFNQNNSMSIITNNNTTLSIFQTQKELSKMNNEEILNQINQINKGPQKNENTNCLIF